MAREGKKSDKHDYRKNYGTVRSREFDSDSSDSYVSSSRSQQYPVAEGTVISLTVAGTDTRHRVITLRAFSELRLHHSHWKQNLDDGQFSQYILIELLPLVGFAHLKNQTGAILKTNYDFKVVTKEEAGGVLWYVPNDINGITVMVPSDH